MEASPPTTKESFKALLELLTLYDRFLEHRAPVSRNMYQLLRRDVAKNREEKHKQAFESIKQRLQRNALTHYDLAKAVVISRAALP